MRNAPRSTRRIRQSIDYDQAVGNPKFSGPAIFLIRQSAFGGSEQASRETTRLTIGQVISRVTTVLARVFRTYLATRYRRIYLLAARAQWEMLPRLRLRLRHLA